MIADDNIDIIIKKIKLAEKTQISKIESINKYANQNGCKATWQIGFYGKVTFDCEINKELS